jgi:hypothetical protein
MFRVNYGEYVFQQILTSGFVRGKLTEIIIAVAANILNLHIVTMLCSMVSINAYIDFWVHIGISTTMALHKGYLYDFLFRYEREFKALTRYLITNYSVENYRNWKRIVVLGASGYASLSLLTVELNNRVLFRYIIQNAICSFIIEQFEEKNIQNYIREYIGRPVTKKLIPGGSEDLLISSYMSPKDKMLRPNKRSDTSFYLINSNRPVTRSQSRTRNGLKSRIRTPAVIM